MEGRQLIMRSTTFFVLVFSALFSISRAQAGPQVATLTQVQGETKLFSNPSKSMPAAQAGVTYALYEGEYYAVKDAAVGDKVEKGNILRTAPNGKARVVYDNGDQFNVGPGTAYRIQWSEDSLKATTQVSLMYGKFRGIVEKGGPRSKLQLRTRSAVMGVRGTDFFVASNGADQSTEVAIIRGSVELKSDQAAAKAVAVKAGESAAVSAAPAALETKASDAKVAKAPVAAPVVEVRKTTQEDLVAIQKASKIEAPKVAPVAAAKEIQAEVAKLEQKAVDTTIKDIKATDPKLAEQITKEMAKNGAATPADVAALSERVNNQSINVAIKTAPKAPEKRKPFASEIEDLEAGAYQRYFKTIE